MDVPPVIGAAAAAPPPVARWRSAIMLLLVAAYPVVLGIAGARRVDGAAVVAALPSTVSGLLAVSAENLGMFGLLCLVVWGLAHPTVDELWARGRGGAKTWALGFGYSVALRVGLGGLTAVALVIAAAVLKAQGKPVESLAAARPQIEHLLDPHALQNPMYLFLVTTLVSFGVGGLREELWRSLVFAASFRLLPQWRDSVRGRLGVVMFAAVIFGLGHLPQGWGGVLLTGALGGGLGAIILFHRSLWVGVLAHGFFDATSLLLVRLVDHLGLLDPFLGK